MANTPKESLEVLKKNLIAINQNYDPESSWFKKDNKDKTRSIDDLKKARIAAGNLASSLRDEEVTSNAPYINVLNDFVENIDAELERRQEHGVGSKIAYGFSQAKDWCSRVSLPDCLGGCIQGHEEFAKARLVESDLDKLCSAVGTPLSGVREDDTSRGLAAPGLDSMKKEDALGDVELDTLVLNDSRDTFVDVSEAFDKAEKERAREDALKSSTDSSGMRKRRPRAPTNTPQDTPTGTRATFVSPARSEYRSSTPGLASDRSAVTDSSSTGFSDLVLSGSGDGLFFSSYSQPASGRVTPASVHSATDKSSLSASGGPRGVLSDESEDYIDGLRLGSSDSDRGMGALNL